MRVLVQIGSTDMRVPDASYNSQAWSCVPDCRRSWALIAETSQAELPLADTVHQLDAGDRSHRIPELLEAKHHSDALLHAPMVLLNQVVQIFRRTQLRVHRQ